MWNSEMEICVTMWWADENHVSDTTTWRCQEHDRDRMATFETHLKFYCHVKWQQNAIFMGLYRRTLFGNILTGFWVYFMWRWILSDWIWNIAIMGIPSAQTGVLYKCLIHAMRLWVNPRHQTPQGQPIRKTESPLRNKIHKVLLIIGSRLPTAMGR